MTPKPKQQTLFDDGSDLPLFSRTPVKVDLPAFTPQTHAHQTSLAACPVCLDTGLVGDKRCTCAVGAARKEPPPVTTSLWDPEPNNEIEYGFEWSLALAAWEEKHTAFTCAVCAEVVEGEPTGWFQDLPLCRDCAARAEAYAERREGRIHYLAAQAEKKAAAGRADVAHAHKMASVIPFGQPILVGHHSEGRDRRYRKRIENTFRRGFETLEESKRLEQRAEAARDNRAIHSDDPLAVVWLQEKIENAEQQQAVMKAANAAIRKHKKAGEDVQIAALVALNFSETRARELLKPDFAGRVGFPDYLLRNNNANIRRMKERLAELRAQVTAEATEDHPLPGVIVKEDPTDNRLRLHFDEKPSEEARAILKRHGWRWSRANTAWQRHLNTTSRHVLALTLDELQKLA